MYMHSRCVTQRDDFPLRDFLLHNYCKYAKFGMMVNCAGRIKTSIHARAVNNADTG